MNRIPVGLAFAYPQGLPAHLPPGTPLSFQIQVSGTGGAVPASGSGTLWVSLGGGPFEPAPTVHLGGDLYEVTLPAVECTEVVSFYFSAEDSQGALYTDPDAAPVDIMSLVAAAGVHPMFDDHTEGDVSGWTVVNDPALGAGAWEAAVPNGTITVTGEIAAPNEDADASIDQIHAWVTENGEPGGGAAMSDVDGGPTDLVSPVFDLAGSDATITYKHWFFDKNQDDVMTVWVTADGANWVLAQTIPSAPSPSWLVSSFRVGQFVTPSSTVQVRFRAHDVTPIGVVEAGLDAFSVEKIICGDPAVAAGGLDASGVGSLVLARSGDDVTLSWGDSCAVDDTDWEVYEGRIGTWGIHAARLCSTGGATTATLTPGGDAMYYLVVPTNGGAEGSYGRSSDGLERPPGSPACYAQNTAACD